MEQVKITFRQKVRLERITFALRHGVITKEEAKEKIHRLFKGK